MTIWGEEYKIQSPRKADYKKWFITKDGELIGSGYGEKDLRRLIDSCKEVFNERTVAASYSEGSPIFAIIKENTHLGIQIHDDAKAYEKNRKLYVDTAHNLINKYKKALYKYAREYYDDNLTDKVLDIIYDRAYDQSHSYGYVEVESTFESLVNFVCNLKDTGEFCEQQ